MAETKVPDGWTRLELPVPPVLEEALGYPGDARFVAFANESYDDGCRSGTADRGGFATFFGHPGVAPRLAGLDLGWDEFDGEDCLVLDREARALYSAPAAVAGRFLLETQRPATLEFPPGLAAGAATSLAEFADMGAWTEFKIDDAAFAEAMRRRGEVMKQLVEFLDENA